MPHYNVPETGWKIACELGMGIFINFNIWVLAMSYEQVLENSQKIFLIFFFNVKDKNDAEPLLYVLYMFT